MPQILPSRTLGIPAMDLWDVVLDNTVPVDFLEDNESTIAVINSGRNPTMRHLQRTHDVSVKWLSDTFRFLKPRLSLINCDTVDQSADIFTKAS